MGWAMSHFLLSAPTKTVLINEISTLTAFLHFLQTTKRGSSVSAGRADHDPVARINGRTPLAVTFP